MTKLKICGHAFYSFGDECVIWWPFNPTPLIFLSMILLEYVLAKFYISSPVVLGLLLPIVYFTSKYGIILLCMREVKHTSIYVNGVIWDEMGSNLEKTTNEDTEHE